MEQQQWELEKKLKEMQLAQMSAKSSGGGGGGRSSGSSKKSTSSGTTTASTPSSMEKDLAAYYQNKFENYMAPRPWSAAEGMKGPRPIF